MSAPTDGTTGLDSFQVDAGYHDGAIWGAGNAPAVDTAGEVFVATGNGNGNSSTYPDYGDSVVKLNALAAPLDWWAPPNWQALDSSDLDLGSSMPALLPGGLVFESGKDDNGYLLNGAHLGGAVAAVAKSSGFCSGGSFGGAVYDSGNSTIYAACNSGLRALTLGAGPPPSLAARPGFSAPPGATGPPMIAAGLVWVTDHSDGTLYGLDLSSGATTSQFPIPEHESPGGSDVNHFASPSAGGGRLFVGSGDQVTAYTIAQPPPLSSTSTALITSANPASPGAAVSLTAAVTPTPDAGTVTFTDGGAPLSGCRSVAVSAATAGRAVCRTAFAQPGTHKLVAAYSGDAFYAGSSSAVLAESVPSGVPRLSRLRVSSHRVSIAGRRIGRRCLKPSRRNRRHRYCRRPFKLKVAYTLNAPAMVVFTLKRQAPGRKLKGRCVRPTRKNHRAARCTRLVPVPGSIRRAAKAGANAFTFTGTIGRHRLGPGSYRLTAAPTANGRSGTPEAVSLTIVG